MMFFLKKNKLGELKPLPKIAASALTFPLALGLFLLECCRG